MFEAQMDFISKGGILIFPIMFLSIIALAIFLERIFTLRLQRYAPKAFLDSLYELLRDRKLKEARILAQQNTSSVSMIAREVLDNVDLPLSRLMETAEEAGRSQAKRYERYLASLQAIASISPLLGLLGTVIGMIKTFVVISSKGVGDAQALAGGISEALVTTAAGLSVAIPTIVFFYIVRHRSENVTLEVEKAVSKMINLIYKEG